MNESKIVLDELSEFLKSEILFYKKMKRKHGVKNSVGHYHVTKCDTLQEILDYINELKEEHR
jgi:hypothetical protein